MATVWQKSPDCCVLLCSMRVQGLYSVLDRALVKWGSRVLEEIVQRDPATPKLVQLDSPIPEIHLLP